jgi:CheY-like chemotaxis protein
VESRRNEGTTVRIYLPASDKPVESKEEVVEEPVYGRGKILVMDDEDIIISTLGRMLPHSGYEVEFSRDGAEAIELYTRTRDSGKPFDAVIMDLTVPGGMGGMEAVKKLLEIDPEAKVIVSSGYSTDLVMADYEEHGFSGIMTKPYSVEDLRITLDMILKPGSEAEIPDGGKEAAAAGDKKVLLMDDSELIKKAVSESLPDLGYRIEFASTGDEAISIFKKALEQEQPFDVVILDLSISTGLGGEDTIKRLREMKPEVLAVVSSGYISDPVMLEPEKHGFNATLEKPFGIEDLEELLNKLLSER